MDDASHDAPRCEDDAVELRQTESKGIGVYATRPIERGERLFAFRGPLLSTAEVQDFSRAIQCGPDSFLGPSGEVDDYVNHSCNPNCGVADAEDGGIELVALRRIEPGEELAYDYSTCILREPWRLRACRCGSDGCRKRINTFWSLPPETRQRYIESKVVPRYILEAKGRSRS